MKIIPFDLVLYDYLSRDGTCEIYYNQDGGETNDKTDNSCSCSVCLRHRASTTGKTPRWAELLALANSVGTSLMAAAKASGKSGG